MRGPQPKQDWHGVSEKARETGLPMALIYTWKTQYFQETFKFGITKVLKIGK